jgi:3-hydroxyacyl-CoA dehydrogenase
MGSGIACHFANAGFEVIMLDMASEGNDRSAFAHAALEKMIKTNPAPLYSKKFRSRIETGNLKMIYQD